MKNFLIVLFIFITTYSHGISQQAVTIEMYNVMNLINFGLNENFEQIQAQSKDFSIEEKKYIYDIRSKDAVMTFAINILGLGIGSWIQGDYLTGCIGTFGMIGGYSIVMITVVDAIIWPNNINTEAGLIVGFSIMAASYAATLILPFVYSNSFNTKLKNALGMNQESNINIQPNIGFNTNGINVGLVMSF